VAGSQLDLFGGPAVEENPRGPVGLVRPLPEHVALAGRLPAEARLGTSSWSFPGWQGILWDRAATQTTLARQGLAAYARHPLLRTVGIDRSFYGPLSEAQYAGYAAQAPPGFRFLVKALEALTVERWPDHPRGGALRGQSNPLFLDPAHAIDAVVGPLVRGLGERAGPIVFQFPPQPLASTHGPERFAERLHGFLAALPKGPIYAVELRNGELLGPALGAALREAGAALCYAAWQQMPPVSQQARRVPPDQMPALVVRWMLPRGRNYEAAREAFAPFDRLQAEDPETRAEIAALVRAASARGQGCWVTVNNKAEGCAPESVFRLAEEIAAAAAR
jgi:uncharacterized protein YecE (DUF72 family)